MRYWYDCEFIENGRTIDLISIGIVSEDDRELYLVNEKIDRPNNPGKLYHRIAGNRWLMQNVVPHLPLNPNTHLRVPNRVMTGQFDLDHESLSVVPLAYIRKAVRDFVCPGPDHSGDVPNPVELWAWCGAYDHVALMQLFGTMAEKPDWFPPYTNDFQQLLDAAEVLNEWLPKQIEGQHNALADAKHLRWMMESLDLDEVRRAYRADQEMKDEDTEP